MKNCRCVLLTPAVYSSKDNENCSDIVSESFAKGLKVKIEEEWKFSCDYNKISGKADVERLDIFEDRYLKVADYIIIIASPHSKSVVESFVKKLLLWLKNKDDWKERFLFVALEGVEVDFINKSWKVHSEDMMQSLQEKIKNKWIEDKHEKMKEDHNMISRVITWLFSWCGSKEINEKEDKVSPNVSESHKQSILEYSEDKLKKISKLLYPFIFISTIEISKQIILDFGDDVDFFKKYHNLNRNVLLIGSMTSLAALLGYLYKDNLKRIFIPTEVLRDSKPRGLRNTKETCYMNSMMQALASSPILMTNLTTTKEERGPNEKFQSFLDTLIILNTPTDDDNDDEATNKLISFMNTAQWNRLSQQDAFQLLSFFINFIQKDVGISKDSLMPPKFKIVHTFSEDSKYNKVQDHLAFALPLCGKYKELPGESLESLMDEFFAPSMIDNGPYNTQLYLFKEAPEVMIIHIQANEWNDDLGTYVKPKYYIKYEKQLKYTFKIQNKVDGSEMVSTGVTYQLMAVVHHMGSISGGHYITYRRHGQTWYLTNDTQVEEVSFKCDIVPYIMVYEKRK